MKSKYFNSTDHELNSTEVRRRTKNGKQPVKRLTPGELAAFAASRGMTVSTKTIETAKQQIDISALPDALKRFVK